MSVIKEFWRGRRFYTAPYPLLGARSTGTAPVPVDLLKNIQEDTVDTLSVHILGNVLVAGAGPGTPTGMTNPAGLITLSTLSTAPQAAGLIPVNAVSARGMFVDYAMINHAFETFPPIPDVAGTYAVDFWLHYNFKRGDCKKGIEFAHPLKKWTTDLMTLVMGTRDQLYTGGTNTWDLSGLTIEFWADMDVNTQPDNIHAIEIFEQTFNILASNSNFQITTLPAGVFYDNLTFCTENNGALSDGIINNIDIEGAGRFWLPQGESNASFIRNVYTRQQMFDPNQVLTGLYFIPLRDGLWSRGIDATSQTITIKLNVTSLSATTLVRLVGRKIVPGGIKKTLVQANGSKIVSGLPDVGVAQGA
jgi:hypothetical protein